MNAWQTQWTGHKMSGAGSGLGSLSVSLSELCANNGQCLYARQNFNEGGRRW